MSTYTTSHQRYTRKWMKRKQANGLCIQSIGCSNPIAKMSRALCLKHLIGNRLRVRAFRGSKPWIRGKAGRPPLTPDTDAKL